MCFHFFHFRFLIAHTPLFYLLIKYTDCVDFYFVILLWVGNNEMVNIFLFATLNLGNVCWLTICRGTIRVNGASLSRSEMMICNVCYLWHLIVINLFYSESTLKKQLDKEKDALKQSIHKNSALISEKDEQVQTLRSEVRTFCTLLLWYCEIIRHIIDRIFEACTTYIKLRQYVLFHCFCLLPVAHSRHTTVTAHRR